MSDRRKGESVFSPNRRRGIDRRTSARYPAGDIAVRFTWELAGRRGEGRGALCNVGQGGICLLAHEAPPRGVKVAVRLEGYPAVPAVEGSVAHVMKTRLMRPGPVLVGIRLREPCPYEFFSAAVSHD
jgi:hypothetical protein